jgi:hypothetical protein
MAKSAHHISVHRCIFNLVITLYLLSQCVWRFQQQLSYYNGCSLYNLEKLNVVQVYGLLDDDLIHKNENYMKLAVTL